MNVIFGVLCIFGEGFRFTNWKHMPNSCTIHDCYICRRGIRDSWIFLSLEASNYIWSPLFQFLRSRQCWRIFLIVVIAYLLDVPFTGLAGNVESGKQCIVTLQGRDFLPALGWIRPLRFAVNRRWIPCNRCTDWCLVFQKAFLDEGSIRGLF